MRHNKDHLQQFHIRLPRALHMALKVRAARETTTVNALVTRALRALLRQRGGR